MKTKQEHCYDYPRPAVSTDILVFGIDDQSIRILLIRRKNEPFQNTWALPGGFLEMDEPGQNGALRELKEETSLELEELQHLGAYSEPDRDPRGRMISLAYYEIVHLNEVAIQAADDAKEAQWFELNELPELAFDHKKMIDEAILDIRRKSMSEGYLLRKTGHPFTLKWLYDVHRKLYMTNLSFSEFRSACLQSDIFLHKGSDDEEKYQVLGLFSIKDFLSFYSNLID